LVIIWEIPYIYWTYHPKWWASGGTWIFFAPTENHILVDFDVKKFPISKLSFLGK
jgi:hypothetical protein